MLRSLRSVRFALPALLVWLAGAHGQDELADFNGRWSVPEDVGFPPWIFDFRVGAGSVTGTVTQGSSDPVSGLMTNLTGPFPIYEGIVAGNTIEFRVRSPDGGRISDASRRSSDASDQ